MHPALSLDQAPPILVPFRFFLSAPVFGLLASLFSLSIGSDMLSSRWLPSVLALTHLMTLGVIGMVMLGALFQMLPVVAGAPVARESLVSQWVYGLFGIGSLSLAVGFYQESTELLAIAIIALGSGLLLFIMAAGQALWRAPRSHDSVRGMQLAIVASLPITLALGLLLAAGHAWDGVPFWREELTNSHLLWGAVGWVGLLVGVIAYQVVPMFQMTPEYPSWIRRYWAWSLFALLVFTALSRIISPALMQLSGVLVGTVLLVFAIITLQLQRKRKRRLPDVTMSFWRLGMLSLIVAVVIYMLNIFWPQPAFDFLLGTLFLFGFALSVMNGMLYKIVPFIVWLHLQNKLLSTLQLGKIRIPNMKQVIPERLIRYQYGLHLLALLLLIAAVFIFEQLFRPAWLLFLLSFALLGFNLWSAYRCYLVEMQRIMAGTNE